MSKLRVLKRGNARAHAELGSLFVVSLPRSLSSLLYVAAAHALGLAEPTWTSDGEILNRDRVPRRLQSRKQSLAPADERFTLLGSAPDVFASMTSYLDQAALRHEESAVFHFRHGTDAVVSRPGFGERARLGRR